MKITVELPPSLARQVQRVVKEGTFSSPEEVALEALEQLVEAKTMLGDTPRMLHRFAADALNDSKPETALRFCERALELLNGSDLADLVLYQSVVELKVQILLIMERADEAKRVLEEAWEKLPNSPVIARWIERVQRGGNGRPTSSPPRV